MTTNWAYLYQQLIVLVISGALTAVVLTVFGVLGFGSRSRWWRLCLEYPVIAAGLFVLGIRAGHLSLPPVIPTSLFPWTVGVGLAFYWMAVWWPLRVWRRRDELYSSRGGQMTLALAVISVLGAGYAVFIEPRALEIEERTLLFDELGEREVRIAHISDTQLIGLGPREKALVDAVNDFRPHMIIFSGDYIAGTQDEEVAIEAMRWILSRLRSSHGMFGVNSDSDNERQRGLMFEGMPFTYLLNKSVTLDVEGVRFRIGGLNHTLPRWSRMTRGSSPEEMFIVTCHLPDHAEETGRQAPDVDLYLCGHTHGGQVQVPFFGPPVTMSTVDRHIAAGGIFKTSTGMTMALSRGVGMEGDYAPRFRFNCPPHVFLLTLGGRDADSPR